MTIQIAVGLPAEAVEFLDRLVAEKKAASRAKIVARWNASAVARWPPGMLPSWPNPARTQILPSSSGT